MEDDEDSTEAKSQMCMQIAKSHTLECLIKESHGWKRLRYLTSTSEPMNVMKMARNSTVTTVLTSSSGMVASEKLKVSFSYSEVMLSSTYHTI
jgi:hypothetical protein